MNPAHATPLDAELLYADLLARLRDLLAQSKHKLQLAGIPSGGAWLVERLQSDLGLPGEPGVVSSGLHRDDFARRGLAVGVQTHLPFEVNGAHVVLVDDVLHTGRTLRAVINELFDFGRPASVQLAVLVERGGRELPMEATVCAAHVNLPNHQSLELARDENGAFRFVIEPRRD